MNDGIATIFNESIFMEKHVAQLYRHLSKTFSDEQSFWQVLAYEEESHAYLLRLAKDLLFKEMILPIKAVPKLSRIQEFNTALKKTITKYESSQPSKKDIFKKILDLEGLLGEYYFQISLNPANSNPAVALLKTLSENEMNHVRRITERAKKYL